MAKNQQQKRAECALKRIQKLVNDNNTKNIIKSYAHAFPAMIQMNGLGQAAAFYLSKGDEHKQLYRILSDWLTMSDQPYGGKNDLLHGITEGDMHQYRVAQAEALLLLEWVKRFASVYFEDKPEEQGETRNDRER